MQINILRIAGRWGGELVYTFAHRPQGRIASVGQDAYIVAATRTPEVMCIGTGMGAAGIFEAL